MAKSAALSIVAAQSFDSIGAIKSAALAIHSGANALEIINTKAKELRTHGVTFGKSVKTCANRANLMDAMAAQFKGKTAKTYANYVTSFVAAVNDGAEFSFSSSKGEAKGGKKDPKPKAEKSIIELFAALYNHADFAETINTMGEEFLQSHDNDENPILSKFVAGYLELNGYEINA